MRDIPLNFDPAEARREIEREPWEGNARYVALGSCFALTPSGKYYQPFACSNVAACPVCEGRGEVATGLRRRVERKWRNENRRRRRLWIQRYGRGLDRWPAHIRRASDALNRKWRRCQGGCPRCGGLGSAEAWDDERWTEKAEDALRAVGLALTVSEGDPTVYLAAEYREEREEDDEG